MFLRTSDSSVDRSRVQRLKTPSRVTFLIRKCEFEFLATTGFYLPADFHQLVTVATTKINGKFLSRLVLFADHFLSASRELAKKAYITISSLLVGSNICVMYRPLTVVAIALYTTCLRASTGIPNLEDGRAWFSCIDPSLNLSFLHSVSQSVLRLLPQKGIHMKKAAVPEIDIKKEPLSNDSRSVSPDSGIESPPFAVKIKEENDLQW